MCIPTATSNPNTSMVRALNQVHPIVLEALERHRGHADAALKFIVAHQPRNNFVTPFRRGKAPHRPIDRMAAVAPDRACVGDNGTPTIQLMDVVRIAVNGPRST